MRDAEPASRSAKERIEEQPEAAAPAPRARVREPDEEVGYPTDRRGPAGHLWPWQAFESIFVRGSLEAGHGKMLSLHNLAPRFAGEPGLLTNIAAGLHVVHPGESAEPHRHAANALRIVIQGRGVTTIVDGKEHTMAEGDLVFLPGWCWHEHVHRGAEPVVWLEILDVPLHEHLRTVGFEAGPAKTLPRTVEDAAFTVPHMVPRIPRARKHTPVFHYRWESASAAVALAPVGRDGARRVDYTNPLTGGPAMSILEAHVLQVDPGEETVPYRTSADAVCLVVEGSGSTRVGDKTLRWGPKDILTLPHSNWISHRADGAPARILVVTDADLLRRLDLLFVEHRDPV